MINVPWEKHDFQPWYVYMNSTETVQVWFRSAWTFTQAFLDCTFRSCSILLTYTVLYCLPLVQRKAKKTEKRWLNCIAPATSSRIGLEFGSPKSKSSALSASPPVTGRCTGSKVRDYSTEHPWEWEQESHSSPENQCRIPIHSQTAMQSRDETDSQLNCVPVTPPIWRIPPALCASTLQSSTKARHVHSVDGRWGSGISYI